MARQQSRGQCYLCKGTFPKASMARHLTKCLATHENAATSAGNAKKGKLFHLVVVGKHQPQYWLHLEMPATAKLEALDEFLRDIWLECCGHLSAFKIEGRKRPLVPYPANLAAYTEDWVDPDEVDMESRVGDVLEKGSKLSHEYDFGSTTELSVTVVGEREGLVKKPDNIRLLARNDPPFIPCGRCNKAAATVIDAENSYDESGWLCDRCAKKADLLDDGMSLPVVNSPRTGVCGYTGE